MKLDFVRRDTSLMVEEIEEGDPDQLRVVADLDCVARVLHLLPALGRGCGLAVGNGGLGDHRVRSAADDDVEVAVVLFDASPSR